MYMVLFFWQSLKGAICIKYTDGTLLISDLFVGSQKCIMFALLFQFCLLIIFFLLRVNRGSGRKEKKNPPNSLSLSACESYCRRLANVRASFLPPTPVQAICLSLYRPRLHQRFCFLIHPRLHLSVVVASSIKVVLRQRFYSTFAQSFAHTGTT